MRATIAEQLVNLKLGTKKSNQPFFSLEFPSVLNLGKEGEDHINCWENSNTKLGRALSLVSGPPLNHSIFGRFRTMLGFWNFVLLPSQDDELRTLNGKALHSLCTRLNRQHHSNSSRDDFKFIRNFRAIILDAYYQRVMGSNELKDLIKRNELEIDCYYIRTDNGLRVRNKNFKWMIPLFAELSAAVKEDRAPDYELFMSHKDIDIYYDVLPQCVAETMDARAKAKHERSVKLKQAREAKRQRELEAALNTEYRTEAAVVSQQEDVNNSAQLSAHADGPEFGNAPMAFGAVPYTPEMVLGSNRDQVIDTSDSSLREAAKVSAAEIAQLNELSDVAFAVRDALVKSEEAISPATIEASVSIAQSMDTGVISAAALEDYVEDSPVKKKHSGKAPLPPLNEDFAELDSSEVDFDDGLDPESSNGFDPEGAAEEEEEVTAVLVNEPTANETAMALALKNALKQ